MVVDFHEKQRLFSANGKRPNPPHGLLLQQHFMLLHRIGFAAKRRLVNRQARKRVLQTRASALKAIRGFCFCASAPSRIRAAVTAAMTTERAMRRAMQLKKRFIPIRTALSWTRLAAARSVLLLILHLSE